MADPQDSLPGLRPRPVAIDLFCGAGGMSVGFEQAGFDILLSVDRDPYHVAAHHRNFPYGQTLLASVTDLTGDRIRELLGPAAERGVDLVYGGPPCQGFSTMGIRDAADPRNSLVDHFCRIVEELAPRAFVMENVPGMNTGGTSAIFTHALSRLRQAGYNLTLPVRTLNAADLGVPQARKRLFILGIRSDVGLAIPYPEDPPAGLTPRPTVWQAIADLPDVDEHETLFKEDAVPYSRLPADTDLYALIARGLRAGESDFSRPRAWNREICSGCQRVRHGTDAQSLYASTRPGAMVPGHKLPRLDPAGLAPTLRAGTDSERGSHTAPRPVHPFRPRVITVREAARLHGYPDWFAFYPGKWHAYRQVGNSVCPPVAHAVGLQVMDALGIRPAELERPAVQLGDRFELPEDRPKQQARIPIVAEFPKVIAHLWARAWDEAKQKLVRPEFSTEDIQRAMTESGAELPRVRADRFLIDTARYRGVEKLISEPLRHGFTILVTDSGSGAGRFVSRGTLGAMAEGDQVELRSAELNEALPLEAPLAITGERDLVRLVESPRLISLVTEGDLATPTLQRDLFDLPRQGPYLGSIVGSKGSRSSVLVVPVLDSKLPTRTRIRDLAASKGADWTLLVAAVTQRHVLFVVFDTSGGGCGERWRATFAFGVSRDIDPISVSQGAVA